MKLFRWILDSMARTYVALAVLALGVVGAHAAVSYDVHNVPDMFLNQGITNTQTSGITIAPPTLNGVEVTFPTTSGAVLEISQGSRLEWVHYTSATVNQSTKVITLGGTVTRNVCFNIARSIVSCGNGQPFSRGALVRLVDDARLLNTKANIDRHNRFTAPQSFSGTLAITGPIVIDGTTSYLSVPTLTTAQRDAITPFNGMVIYNSTTSVLNQYIGGAWTAVGTDATVNAGFNTAGKGQLIGTNTGALLNRTMSGSVGPFILSPSITKATSSGGTIDAGKIVVISRTGKIANGFLPTSSVLNQVFKSAYYNASAGDQILANVAGGSFTISLPTSPSAGDRVAILQTNTGASNALVRIRGSGTSLNIMDRWNSTGSVNLYHKGDYVELTNSGATSWIMTKDDRISHRVLLTRNVAQSIANAGDSKVFFDTTVYDIGGMVDTGTGGRVVIRRSGQYRISAGAEMPGGDTQDIKVSIYKNGTLTRRVSQALPDSSGYVLAGSWELQLIKGDYLEVKVFQQTGSADDTPTTEEGKPHFSVSEILR